MIFALCVRFYSPQPATDKLFTEYKNPAYSIAWLIRKPRGDAAYTGIFGIRITTVRQIMIETEYSILRGQITQQDNVCLTMIGALLGATTASYSLYVEKSWIIAIPMLSVIWLIGFLYISEKRFWIKKTAFYIRTEIEQKCDDLNWQTWLKENTSDKRFLRISPLKLEYSIFLIVCVVNVSITVFEQSEVNWIYVLLTSIPLLIAIVLGFTTVKIYYTKTKQA